MEEETLNAIEDVKQEALQKLMPFMPRNRAERRALEKKLGKKGRAQYPDLIETSKKLAQIDLIQKLRELNEKKENENEHDDSNRPSEN